MTNYQSRSIYLALFNYKFFSRKTGDSCLTFRSSDTIQPINVMGWGGGTMWMAFARDENKYAADTVFKIVKPGNYIQERHRALIYSNAIDWDRINTWATTSLVDRAWPYLIYFSSSLNSLLCSHRTVWLIKTKFYLASVPVSSMIETIATCISSIERDVTDDLKAMICEMSSGALLYSMLLEDKLNNFSDVIWERKLS